jgi:hypothetical protein
LSKPSNPLVEASRLGIEVGHLSPEPRQCLDEAADFAVHQFSFSPFVEVASVAPLNSAELTVFLTGQQLGP